MVTPSQPVACPPAMESSARRSVAAGTPPPVPWVVSAADKARYDVMFTNADLDHDQLVSGNEIKNIFLQPLEASPLLVDMKPQHIVQLSQLVLV